MAIKTKKVEVPDRKFVGEASDATVELYREQHPIDPRRHVNNGIMVCAHGRYDLGDEDINTSRYNGWRELKQELKEEGDVFVVLPMYMLDHSGLSVSTTPFNNKWDSGKIGFIYTTKDHLESLGHDVDELEKEEVEEWLRSEVDSYDKYLRGDVYRCVFKENGEEKDRFGSIMSDDPVEAAFEALALEREDYEEVSIDEH